LLSRDNEGALAGDADVNLIALLESQFLHHGEGKADGEAVAPFRDPHQALLQMRRFDQHYPARRSSALVIGRSRETD
jgi:hypothetical protein